MVQEEEGATAGVVFDSDAGDGVRVMSPKYLEREIGSVHMADNRGSLGVDVLSKLVRIVCRCCQRRWASDIRCRCCFGGWHRVGIDWWWNK